MAIISILRYDEDLRNDICSLSDAVLSFQVLVVESKCISCIHSLPTPTHAIKVPAIMIKDRQ